jgi:hypothetical protein
MIQPKYMGGLGFRDIEIFNLAMLARQVWRILQYPESLSSRVLKAIYFPNEDLMDARLGISPSQIWRAVHEGIGVLKQGLIRRIGDGRSTSIWYQNWIPRGEHMRPITSPGDSELSKISELIDSTNACWNEAVLCASFLPMDVEAIMSIPISTMNQAYRMLVETKKKREDWLERRPASSNTATGSKNWTTLWKIKIPSKIRVFAWRFVHKSLPSADVLQKRNMATHACCSICNALSDSWRH